MLSVQPILHSLLNIIIIGETFPTQELLPHLLFWMALLSFKCRAFHWASALFIVSLGTKSVTLDFLKVTKNRCYDFSTSLGGLELFGDWGSWMMVLILLSFIYYYLGFITIESLKASPNRTKGSKISRMAVTQFFQ